MIIMSSSISWYQSSSALTTFMVTSDGMAPSIRSNDLVNADENSSFADLRIGDIIVFKALTLLNKIRRLFQEFTAVIEEGNNLTGNVILCAPIAINEVIQEKTILTKGDANECSIPGIDFPITKENYVGKVVSDFMTKGSTDSSSSNNGTYQIIKDYLKKAVSDFMTKESTDSSSSNNGTYQIIKELGSFGSEIGKFNHPRGIAIDSKDNIYVADTYNDRIQKFDSDGNFIKQWGLVNAHGSHPLDIFIDNEEKLNVLFESLNYGVPSRVQQFDKEGNHIANSYANLNNFKIKETHTTAFNSTGYKFYLDTDGSKIQIFPLSIVNST